MCSLPEVFVYIVYIWFLKFVMIFLMITVMVFTIIYYITVATCGDVQIRIPADPKYNELQGVLTSSYSPINSSIDTGCFMVMRDLPSRATVRFQLIHSNGLTGPINVGDGFSSTANAGDTLLETADSTNRITTTYIDVPAPGAMFIIRYEGKYFYRIIYKLYNNIYNIS